MKALKLLGKILVVAALTVTSPLWILPLLALVVVWSILAGRLSD